MRYKGRYHNIDKLNGMRDEVTLQHYRDKSYRINTSVSEGKIEANIMDKDVPITGGSIYHTCE